MPLSIVRKSAKEQQVETATLRHILANFCFSVLPISRMFMLRRLLLTSLGYEIQPTAKICGKASIFGRGNISVDSDTWVSLGCKFFSHPNAPISIGANCDIGPFVSFITGTHEIGTHERRAGTAIAKGIHIGANSWIGAHTILLAGVRVGSGSIVGAGSVLLEGSYPANSLIVGNPGRVVKTYDG